MSDKIPSDIIAAADKYKDTQMPCYSVREARKLAFLDGYSLASKTIDDLLKGIGYWHCKQLATDGREELEKALAYIKDTLGDCRDYMDDKADVDVDNDYFIPNKEAKLLSRIDSTIELLNKHYERK